MRKLRPADDAVTVSIHPRFTREQLAELLALAHPDAQRLAAELSAPGGLYLADVKRDVENTLSGLGSRALDADERPAVTALHRKIVDYAYDFERTLAHHEPSAQEFLPVLREGLAFLYDVEHPRTPPPCSHHGKRYPVNPWRTLDFVPVALGAHGGPVLVVEAHGWDGDGLAEGEVDRVVELLAGLGFATSSTWNGERRMPHGSIGLVRSASRSLMASVWPDRD